MTNKLSLTAKLRTGHVKRWQIVRVAREQTIAEHMYRVNLIAMEICKVINMDHDLTNLIRDWALIHDLPEVITGDLATPVKQAMRKAVPADDPIRHIELELDDGYAVMYDYLKYEEPLVLDIVKLADLLEASAFLKVEGIGDHAHNVLIGINSDIFRMARKISNDYIISYDKLTIVISEIIN